MMAAHGCSTFAALLAAQLQGCMLSPTHEERVDPRARLEFRGLLPEGNRAVQLEAQDRSGTYRALALTFSAPEPTDEYWGRDLHGWQIRQRIPLDYWQASEGQGTYAKVRAQLMRARREDRQTLLEPETPLYTFDADYATCAISNGVQSPFELIRECASDDSPELTLYSRDYCPAHYGPRVPASDMRVDAGGGFTLSTRMTGAVTRASVSLNGHSFACTIGALSPSGSEISCSGRLQDIGFAEPCDYRIWKSYAPHATYHLDFRQSRTDAERYAHCASRVVKVPLARDELASECLTSCHPLRGSLGCAADRTCAIAGARGETACVPPGAGDVGATCESVLQCQAGLVCTGLFEQKCQRLCSIGGINRDCASCVATSQTPPGVGICL